MKRTKPKSREKIPVLLEKVLAGEDVESDGISTKGKLCFTASSDYDDYFHQNFGKKLVGKDSTAAFCGVFGQVQLFELWSSQVNNQA